MKIPRIIFNVLNEKKGFDNLFMWKLKESKSSEEAYLKAVEYVQEFIPDFKEPYNGFDSYRSKHHLDVRGEVEVPDDIIRAYVFGIDAIFQEKLKRWKINKLAYEYTISYINRYLPDFHPYKNYQSFMSANLYKKKKEVSKNPTQKKTQTKKR